MRRMSRRVPAAHQVTQLGDTPSEWTARRARVAILLIALVVLGLCVAAVTHLVGTAAAPPSDHSNAPTSQTGSPQNLLAAAELPTFHVDLARPGPLSTQTSQPLRLPLSTSTGPAQVPTGYPQTPSGALAQLAAIDVAALGGASITRAQEVIDAWSTPGGPTRQTWSGVQGVATLLSTAGLPANAAAALTMNVRPAMGFIKGTVGADFVVPCINFIVTVSVGGPSQSVAVADCQRMVWQARRWVIGPGAEPAPAPSLWPGTQASYDAGYQPLLMGQP
jgi:hypothetical protein